MKTTKKMLMGTVTSCDHKAWLGDYEVAGMAGMDGTVKIHRVLLIGLKQ